MPLPAHFSELAVAEVMHSEVIDCSPRHRYMRSRR